MGINVARCAAPGVFSVIGLGQYTDWVDWHGVAVETNESESHEGQPKIVVSKNAFDVLQREAFRFSLNRREVRLVAASLAQLGLTGKVPLHQIYQARLKIPGLRLCPIDTGPVLRLAYLNQIVGERLVIMSYSIRGMTANRNGKSRLPAKPVPDGTVDLFCLDSEPSGLYLRAVPAALGSLWDDEFKYVFMEAS